MAKATVNGLRNLRRPEDVARIRGLTIAQVLPYRPPAEEDGAEAETEPAPEPEAVAPEAAPAADAELEPEPEPENTKAEQ
jgi:hypothetical protein